VGLTADLDIWANRQISCHYNSVSLTIVFGFGDRVCSEVLDEHSSKLVLQVCQNTKQCSLEHSHTVAGNAHNSQSCLWPSQTLNKVPSIFKAEEQATVNGGTKGMIIGNVSET
jgi:hypothetical protein